MIPRDSTRITCTVAYRETSLLFRSIRRISLLVNNKVVETHTKGFKRKGKVTFAMDVGNLTTGRTHSWHAEAQVRPFLGLFPFFQSTEVSPKFTLIKEMPLPSEENLTPEPECKFDDSYLYFTGHNEASSFATGQVNLSWFPALVYGVQQRRFLYCGNITYDAFVVKGEYNFLSNNFTYGQLLEFVLVPGNNAFRLETSSRTLLVRNLEPEASYSILVTARTSLGHYSSNRAGALVHIADRDAKLNADFTRMILVPKPTDTFDIQRTTSGGNNNFEFSGDLPDEVLGLKRFDFVYVVDSLGDAALAQLLNVVGTPTGTKAVYSYQSVDLSNIFDELDFFADATNSYETDDAIVDEPNAGDALDLARRWNATKGIVKQDVCAIITPGSNTTDCLDFSSIFSRRLSVLSCPPHARARPPTASPAPSAPTWAQPPSRIRTACAVLGNRNTRSIQKLYSAAEPPWVRPKRRRALRAASPPWLTPEQKSVLNYTQASLIFIDQSGQFVTPNKTIEVGVQGDVSAQVRFSINLSKGKGIQQASLRLFGDIRMTSYVYHAAPQTSQVIKSPPLDLFSTGFFNQFKVDEVPVFLDHAASATAFVELASVSDGKSLLWASDGYNFDVNFSYDRSRSPQYQTSSLFRRSTPFSNSPAFYQRANVATEITLLFGWELSLNRILQAAMTLELGTSKTLEVGTNVEAMVVTDPYFYTLDAFRIATSMQARLLVGNSSNLDIISPALNRSLWNPTISANRSYTFQLPTYTPSSNSIPSSLQRALAIARTDSKLANETFISLRQLNALVPDLYNRTRSNITGAFNKSYGLPYVVYSDISNTLTELPTFNWTMPGAPKICNGNDAISLTVVVTSTSLGRRPGRLTAGLWFGNFDPRVLVEDTAWNFTTSRTNLTSITMSLPRSAAKRPDFTGFFEMPVLSTIILRATLDTLPTPYSMFTEYFLNDFFIPRFQCCTSADCGTFQLCNSTSRLCI
jgi:hypothetical protein